MGVRSITLAHKFTKAIVLRTFAHRYEDAANESTPLAALWDKGKKEDLY